jgi:hypothetical protein
MDILLNGANSAVFNKRYPIGNAADPRIVRYNHNGAAVITSYGCK